MFTADETETAERDADSQEAPTRRTQEDGEGNEQRQRRRKKRKQPRPGNGKKIGLIAGGAALVLAVVALAVWLASPKKPEPVQEVASSEPAPTPPPLPKKETKPVAAANPTPPADNQLATTSPKPTAPSTPAESLSADILERARRATVHIDVHQGSVHNTSSGVVVSTSGDTAYIATNYHAFLSGSQGDSTTGVRQPGKGRPPAQPAPQKPPSVQHLATHLQHAMPHKNTPQNKKPAEPAVHVSFYPGTPQEETHAGVVAAFDDEADLAVVKVTGVKSPPTPLLFADESAVSETQPVHLFGYSPTAHNIAVSDGKISQVRRDDLNAISEIQVNGPIGPGNNGGPVIDSLGKVVGMARGAVAGKNFGFVAPTGLIGHMLQGSIVKGLLAGHVKQQGNQLTYSAEVWHYDRGDRVQTHAYVEIPGQSPTKVTVHNNEFEFVVSLADPLHKIRSASLLCAPANGTPVKQDDGKWAPLNNPLKSALIMSEKSAVAPLKFPAGTKLDQQYAFQVSYVNADGQTVYLEPHLIKLTLPKY